MTKFSDISNLVLKDSGGFGVGQLPTEEDKADMLTRANFLLGQWNRRRWLVYHLVDNPCTVTGAPSYSVGPGGDFDIARPDRIEAAFIRQLYPNSLSPVDWPLIEIKSREEYSMLPLKSLRTSPAGWFFYDSGYPMGTLFPWPIPQGLYEIHILTKAVLTGITDPDADLILPPEYNDALYWSLMQRARVAYRLPPDKMIDGMARAALNTIRRANFQIGKLQLFPPVGRDNWISGFFFGGQTETGGGPLLTEDGMPILTEDGQFIAGN